LTLLASGCMFSLVGLSIRMLFKTWFVQQLEKPCVMVL
jgi:hypothetical protein